MGLNSLNQQRMSKKYFKNAISSSQSEIKVWPLLLSPRGTLFIKCPLSSECFLPDGVAKIFFLQPHAMAKIQTLVKRVSEPIDGCSTDCATMPRLQNNAAVCQIHHYFLCPLDREMMQPLLPCIIVRYLGWQT